MSPPPSPVAGFASVVELLRARAEERPDQVVYSFLEDGEEEAGSLTWSALLERVRAVAARLQAEGAAGRPVLLLYPSGLEFVTAFLGCLAAGAIAVPTYPPRSPRSLPRLQALIADAHPALALTTQALLPRLAAWGPRLPGLAALRCLATDDLAPELAGEWRDPEVEPRTLAFLQYTSGSTALPKGVMVSHGNLLHNEEMIRRCFGQSAASIVVSWLPLYHDMGLIGGVLQPLYVGGRCILLSPVAFLQRPLRWLAAISRYRATTSGGPNFAYELCVQKIAESERARLDLASWEVAFNGAEPVRAETLQRFADAFRGAGFRQTAFYPCYGLAEATLFVTGGTPEAPPTIAAFDRAALEKGSVQVAKVPAVLAVPGTPKIRQLVACGQPAPGLQLVIADPETGERAAPDQVGEVWIAGPSVARGYWGQEAATGEAFGARLAGEPQAGPFLRTGDLGFLAHGELWVTGRRKDLIILRGRNLHPHDVELAAELAHPALRPGCGAAFAVEQDGEERLVVVWELGRPKGGVDAGAIAEAVRRVVAEELEAAVWEVLLVPAGTVPKTSSGKIQRHACRAAYLAGTWEPLGRSAPRDDEMTAGDEAPLDRGGLAALPPEERRAALTALLRREVARAARVAATEVSAGAPLVAAGIDSLAAVELQGRLAEQLALPLSLADLLGAESLDELATQWAARLTDATGIQEIATTTEALAPGAELPLSAGQRALWFLNRLSPESAAYNLAAAVRLSPPLDQGALARAVAALSKRHAALRTTFHARDGEPWQQVHERLDGAWSEVAADGWSEEELTARLEREAGRPFDLAAGPPLRVTLLTRGPDGAVLLVAIHHLVADFWSLALAARELGALYDRETGATGAALPPLESHYGDFVRRQRRHLEGPAGAGLWEFWRQRLAGAPAALDLPTDRPRPPVQTDRGAAVVEPLDRATAEAVRALARRSGATLFATALAGFAALLHRITGQADLVVGTPTAGRTRPAWSGVFGYFVNPVPLRLQVAAARPFAVLIGEARQAVGDALAHQDFPFPLLTERLQPERDPSRSPIFQVMFLSQKSPLPGQEGLAALAVGWPGVPIALGGLRGESLPLTEATAQLDLALSLAEVDGSLLAALRFNADLFDGATACRLLGHFRVLLAAAGESERPVAELPLLTPAESRQILVEWNDTGGVRATQSLDELVAAQVAATPDAVALVCGGHQITYAALQARARSLAGRLRALGVEAETRVGVLVDRSPDMVAAILGILGAGGAYVPLDPAYPSERLAWMLADCDASALCTRQRYAGLAAGTDIRIVDLDDLVQAPPAPGSAPTSPGSLAYVLYTSGSTGRPKGVAVEHRSAVALVRWAIAAFSRQETARTLASTSICFDLSVFELFVPLTSGGTVVLVQDLLALTTSPPEDVTLINTVPSVLAELLRLQDLPPSIQVVNLAGEPLQRALVESVIQGRTEMKRGPGPARPGGATGSAAGAPPKELLQGELGRDRVPRVCNLYGPSEDTTYSTWEVVSHHDPAAPAIGRPIEGSQAYVLDAGLEPLPAGVPGQLHLAGAGLARGYWSRPELTAERFVPDPFGGEPGARLYATGDLARWLPDGRLDFLGRIDHQVKVRGFRIELGEIEALLVARPELREAAVVVREATPGDHQLVAYVAPQGSPGPTPAELRAHLAARLPAYMVPGLFVKLPALPRTATGKVDRRALPGPVPKPTAAAAPRTLVEELLAGLWCDVLGCERAGPDDDFFHLGGHSLLAVRVASRIRQRLGVDLPLRALFETPTLGGLAERIAQERRATDGRPPLVPVARTGPLPLSFAQQRLWFLHQLEPESPRYNIPAGLSLVGPLRPALLASGLDEVVRRHEALHTRFADRAGEPEQEILPPAPVELPLVDLAALPPEAARKEGNRLAREEARRPFDLERGPLLRALLLRLGEEEHTWLLTLHHVVADGWSLGVLLHEIAEVYDALRQGRAHRLPLLPVQYADFAVWQRSWLAGEVLERQLDHWRRQLADLPALELPADRPRPEALSSRGGKVARLLPPPLAATLQQLARREGATFFMVLLAGFEALLGRSSGQIDFAVGVPAAGRERPEVEPLIGFFVNTLALRANLDDDPDLPTLLARVREVTLDAHAHQDLPFEKLVEELQPDRDLSRPPLVQVLLAMQNVPLTRRQVGDLALQPAAVDAGTAIFDVSLFLAETDRGWELTFEYARDLFDPATVERLAAGFETLLAAWSAAPAERLSDLPGFADAERRQLLRRTAARGVRTDRTDRDRRDGAPAPRPAATPLTLVEELLAGVWCEVLGRERVGPDDDFFDLGGHSLLATRVVARVRARLGVALPVRALFETPTLGGLARRIARSRGAVESGQPPLVPMAREGFLPLSFAQRRLWFLHQLEPESPRYNIPGGVHLAGPLRPALLGAGLDEVVRRHEALRTRFVDRAGEPGQEVLPPFPVGPPLVDLAALPPPAAGAEGDRLARQGARRPFDLHRGPLLRTLLLRQGEGGHVLLLTVHHVVADGWSLGVLLDEIAETYAALHQGRAPRLPALPVQYADFAIWQAGWLAGEALERQLDHWRRQLADLPALELPADRPRPAVPSTRGGKVAHPLPPPLAATLQQLARREGATFFMALLAGFEALLGRLSGQSDFAVGVPVAGRQRPEVEPLIGLFVNTLALRARLDDDPDLPTLLGRVREASLDAHAHQDLPFEKLVEELQPDRDLSRPPLVQVLLAMQNVPLTRREMGGLELSPLAVDSGAAIFDLSLLLAETDRGWRMTFEYARDLFDPPTVQRLAAHVETLLAAWAAAPAERLSGLAWLAAAERHQVLREWNDTGDVRAAQGLDELVAAQAAATPDAVALVCGEHQVTCAELQARARSLAGRLRALGVGAETRVGVLVDRSPDMVAAMLGILAAGAAYVPLDPAYPSKRLAWMLADCGAAALCTRQRYADLAAGTDVRIVDLDDPVQATVDPVLARSGPGSLAYVLYTSGSTGTPKGVAVEHASAVALVRWALEAFSRQETARTLASTSICFDLSVFELFVPLSSGGTVVLVQDLLALTSSPPEDVTLINTVPSVLAELLRLQDLPPSVQVVNLAGEPLQRVLVDRITEERGPGPARPGGATGSAAGAPPKELLQGEPGRDRVPRVCNLYGPSEDTTYSTWEVVLSHDPTAPAIGRPIAGSRAYVLDASLSPLPAGAPGQLHLAGAGLARGYWSRPELTAGRFVPDPFGAEPGARLYATGDLARRRPDGRLDFLGRIDHQVKVRGFRIELGEIEALLAAHPELREAAVVARETAPGDSQLVAYVVPQEPPGPAPAELRAHLAARLPAFMVPALFVALEALPRTATGKVDRRALPAPVPRPETAAAPLTFDQELLASLWGDVLGREGIGAEDDFFALGGHSLLATRVVSRVRDSFGVELPVRALFEAPTLSALAARVAEARRDAVASPPPPSISPADRGGPLPLSFAQQRLWFLHQLEPDGARYNIPAAVRLSGALDPEALCRGLGEVVRRHEALRTRFVQRDGIPVQEVRPPFPLALPRVDLAALDPAARRMEARRLARAEAHRPFDLAGDALLRTTLLRQEEGEHVLLLSVHHTVADGWSLGVLLREVAEAYDALGHGRTPRLPALPVQYADFAAWQRGWLAGEVLERELDVWRRQLSNLPVLELPADRPRPNALGSRGASVAWRPPTPLVGELERLARREGATLFMVALAGFQALLGRLSGQTDFAVGTPIAGRTRTEVEPLIGCFVNTLPLRARLQGEEAFRALVGRVREAALAAHAHQDLPFEKLVEELRPERDLSHAPLVQVLFSLQNAPMPALALPGLALELLPVPHEATRFDLALTLADTGAGLAGTLTYSTELFDGATIARWADALERLLAAAATDPARPLDELPHLSEAAQWQALAEWNDTAAETGVEGCVHRLFALQARRAPNAPAVRMIGAGDAVLTYGELDRRSNRLARRLRGFGVGPEVPVAICVEPSLELLVGLLGILKAGGAYVPLDPTDPAARLAWVLGDVRPGALVTQRALLARLPEPSELPQPPHLVLLGDSEPSEPAEPESSAALDLPADPRHLAYVLYTSGSTGTPKGVLVEHRSLMNYLTWAERDLLGGRATAPLLSRLAFDASLKQLFAPFLGGRAVHVVAPEAREHPAALLRALAAVDDLALNCAPALWDAMAGALARGEAPPPPGLRRLLLGGEKLDRELAARSLGLLPGVELLNLYGPTEATANATCGIVRHPDRITLGRPITNVRLYIVDRDLTPAPVGAPGELCIAGLGVARGYLGRPEQTAERFVPDPWSLEPGGRLYRSGDLARRLPDGEVQFLGRIDHQVKIRGLRVELGEIEATLASHPAVLEAAVLLRPLASGVDGLVAWYSPAADLTPLAPLSHRPPSDRERGESPRATVAAGELRDFLRKRLPEAWVPAVFVELDRLPRLPAGKVDRRALAALAPPDLEASAPAQELSASEEIVAGIWSQLLGDRPVGRDDDFFALGGHSLLATQVVSRLRALFGVELPLRSLFDAPTPAALARWLDQAREAEAGLAAPPIVAGPRGGEAPLSFAQQQLWLLHQLDPESPAYNLPANVHLAGRLDAAALAHGLASVARRHDVLRTTFPLRGSEPVQRIAPELVAALPLVDLGGLADPAAEAERLGDLVARLPFDLARGPLWRSVLVRQGGERHRLLLNLHHAVTDGWSLGILIREMASGYQAALDGTSAGLPDLPLQYADFARWQRAWLADAALAEGLSWWKEQLAGAPRSISLPTDRPPRARPGGAGAVCSCRLPGGLGEALAAIGRCEGATRFMVLLAAFAALLQRTTGQGDVLVGSPVASRNRAEIEGLIGFFVNLLVLRLRPDRGASVASLVRQVRDVALDAYAHQDVPFAALVEALGGERHHPLAPLVQVVFALQEAPLRRLELPGLGLTPLAPHTGTAKFDLSWVLEATDGGLSAAIEYRRELFDAATIERQSRHFTTLLRSLTDPAADPGRPLSELPLLGPAERAQLLVEWNDSAAGVPDAPVHELFARYATGDPGAPAVVSDGAAWTRGELAARAARLARRLRRVGVGPETVVGAYLERSPELVAAFLGILEAGGAYLPIDPAYPPERIALLLEDSAAPVLLTRRGLAGSVPATGARVLLVDEDEAGEPGSGTAAAAVLPDQLAYVIYTSGSTGRPKGVEISHRALANLAAWHCAAYAVTPADRASMIAGVSFDASVWEIWPYLTAGACLLIPDEETRLDPERLAGWLEAHGATCCFLPTPLAEALLATGRPPGASLRLLLVGGERLRRCRPAAATWALVNHYGPTESAVVASAAPVPAAPPTAGALPPIGRPIANTRLYVLDEDLQPMPIGVAGEVAIGGTGLARGYRARPDLTAERFVPSPFEAGERLYRTGDLARLLPGGELDFLGRADHQVKVRGHRIEPAEIEAALGRHPLVREAVVVFHGDQAEGRQLTAYVVPRAPEAAEAGAPELEPRELRGFLQGKLPGFMVPARFLLVAALPLTPNGKLDRRALPPPDAAEETPFAAPETPVEEVVAALWAQLLRRERIGIHDDFYALGGHSLLATRVATRLRQVFKVDLPLKSVFEATTVAELARAVEAHEAVPGQSERVARLVRQLQGMSAQEARDTLRPARVEGGTAP